MRRKKSDEAGGRRGRRTICDQSATHMQTLANSLENTMESPAPIAPFHSAGHQLPANDNRRYAPLSRPTLPSGTVAHIHRRCRLSSGRPQAGWRLELEPRSAPFLDPLMGWTVGRDTLSQVALNFPTLEAALCYVDRQGLRAIAHHDALSRADERALAKRAFSDGTLRRLGLGALQDLYGNAIAEARRSDDEPRRQTGDSPVDVVRRSDLSVEHKRSILMNWAFDEHLRRQPNTAASSLLTEIEQAFLVLEGQNDASASSTPRRAA